MRPTRVRTSRAAVMSSSFFLASALCLGASAAVPSKKVSVDGWADISGNNVAAAREQAIAVAQKRAIEMTAGVHIKTMMSDRSLARVKDDQATFEQEVASKIFAQSEGFIERYKVKSEKQEGSTFKVTLEVEVKDGELMRQLAVLAQRIAGARFPKLMFIVTEEYTDKDGKTVPVNEPTFQAALEDAFLARGFDLVAQEHIQKLRSEEAQVFSDIVNDDNKAAKFAMDYGAEYIVKATARVRYTSYNDLGQKEYHGHAELSTKAINASSAAIVASHKESGNSPANVFSEQDLRITAVRHVAPKAIDNLVSRILESWDRETQNGVRYSVKLYNVKSYRDHGRKFIELLEKMANVKQVKKLSYGGDRLELELFYPVTFDTSQLEDAIMNAVATEKSFKNLDVTYSRGRELNFKM